jgi:hypothetical protein
VNRTRLTPRITTLVPDLFRHEFLMSREPVTDNAIAEVIDVVFLPPVRLGGES